MTPEQMQQEWDSFIEYPTTEKTFVTTTSALLFARHIADEIRKDQEAENESLRADAARYAFVLPVITGDDDVKHTQATVRVVYSHPVPTQPYDQQSLELCEACGWKTLIPPDECLNCERKPVQSAGLLAALERAHAWMENQSDAQSKGGHATFDLMMLREERDAISDTLKATNPAPAQPVFDATISRIMSKVQCFASIWGLVGTRFDSGDMLQQAEDERAEIETAVRGLAGGGV